MSIEKISGLVREMIQVDDSLTDAENCRNAVITIVNEIKKVYPDIKLSFLAYPNAQEGENVHYAILASEGGQKIVINTVKTRRFPFYFGDLNLAVPTFSEMKESDVVK